ncbi:RNA polymerase sigma factor [Planctomycetota bacterium]
MISEAEQYLLEGIRRGDQQAWAQLVQRYQGRLLSFTRARVGQQADSEDIVQDVFVAFVRALGTYRGDCSLETFLFGLLRRKIIDCYRRRGSSHVCLIQDGFSGIDSEDAPSDALDGYMSPDPTVSSYMRKDEQADQLRAVLAEALTDLVEGYKKSLDFTALQIVELVFYCQLSNSEAATALHLTANRIGVTKHRCLQRMREVIPPATPTLDANDDTFTDMLTQTWQILRPSCPKRNTIGRYMLKTLPDDWQTYVEFHLNKLGCHFCRANLVDLETQNAESDHPRALHSRIMQSTVGFLHKA